jgi:hypothetical protein
VNRFAVALAAAFAASPSVWACSTCFGDPNDPQSQGMNAAILTLLGVTYGVFFAMFAAGFVIWRRSRRSGAMLEVSADSEIAPPVPAASDPGPEAAHG